MEWISDPQAWMALLTLTVLEIVLGIDNIVLISILTGRLPVKQQPKGRFLGLSLAMGMRIGLLFSITWVMGLTEPLFEIFTKEISGRDMILFGGGLFLLIKSIQEIRGSFEEQENKQKDAAAAGLMSVLVQIALLDIVFSLDSVITAVGMAEHLAVMVIAVVIAVIIMMIFSGPIARFIERHPTVKMLALSFLLLVGVSLIAEAIHHHIPKGYIYFAMGFSILVEILNLKAGARKSVHLRKKTP